MLYNKTKQNFVERARKNVTREKKILKKWEAKKFQNHQISYHSSSLFKVIEKYLFLIYPSSEVYNKYLKSLPPVLSLL